VNGQILEMVEWLSTLSLMFVAAAAGGGIAYALYWADKPAEAVAEGPGYTVPEVVVIESGRWGEHPRLPGVQILGEEGRPNE
jgi:hypothetical protein